MSIDQFLLLCNCQHPLYETLAPCWQQMANLPSADKISTINILNALLNFRRQQDSSLYRAMSGATLYFENSVEILSKSSLAKQANNYQIQQSQQSKININNNKYYECKISEDGLIATRSNNIHDFYNGLCWLTFPLSKKVINDLHVTEINKHSISGQRGCLRDMLTLFDEGGVIVAIDSACPVDFVALLRQHRWSEAFCQWREQLVKSVRFIVFGHALYEKALNIYKAMTARAIFCQIPFNKFIIKGNQQEFFDHHALVDNCDRLVAKFIQDNSLLASPALLSPLPIFAYPGWIIDNQDEQFYADASIFRPLKRKS